MNENTTRRSKGYGQDVAMAVSIAWGILSAIVWAYTDSAASTCRNALVGALDQSQCTGVTFWHDIAAFSVLGAIIAVVFTGLAMYKARQS
jgi:hypothetical protein